MIVVREVFQIQPDRMREVKAAAREMGTLEAEIGFPHIRMMTDLTGEYYTLVFESEYPDLGTFEKTIAIAFANERWQALYQKIRPAIQGGRREICQLVE